MKTVYGYCYIPPEPLEEINERQSYSVETIPIKDNKRYQVTKIEKVLVCIS